MIGEIFALRRLRWKLTLSYTLVAAVTLLALELILAGAVVVFMNSELLPRMMAQNLRDEVAPRLEKPMSQNPPDVEGVRRENSMCSQSYERTRDRRTPTAPHERRRLRSLRGRLLRGRRSSRLLVSVPEAGGIPEGEQFDAGTVHGLSPSSTRR